MGDTRKLYEYTDDDQLTIFDAEDNKSNRVVNGYVFKTEDDANYFKENELTLIGNIMFFHNSVFWDENPIIRLLHYFSDERFVSMLEQKIKNETKGMIEDCFEQGYSVESMIEILEGTIEESMVILKAIVDSAKAKDVKKKIDYSDQKYNNLSKEEYKKVGSDFVDNYNALGEELSK